MRLTFCHSPSRARREPISKWPVAISMPLEIEHHWRRYSRAFQCSSLLSTMKKSPDVVTTREAYGRGVTQGGHPCP